MAVYAWARGRQFKGTVAFNCLWPRHGIRHGCDPQRYWAATRACKAAAKPRSWPMRLRDLQSPGKECSGNFLSTTSTDGQGVTTLRPYAVSPGTPLRRLIRAAAGARNAVWTELIGEWRR